MISLNSVYQTYQQNGQSFHALNNVSLHIKKGESHGIIGESGAGKSTLLRTINLLARPTQGHVLVNGVDLTSLNAKELRAKRQSMGMIFQHFNLIQNKNVMDNLIMPLNIHNHSISHDKAHEMLSFVGLEDKKKHYPNELSGGQKQRLAIARALMSQPHILLLDEATSALDPMQSEAILNLLLKIKDDFKMTFVVIAHQMSVIKTLCQRVSVMDKGRLLSTDSLDALIHQTASEHQFIQNLKPTLPNYLKNRLNKIKGDKQNPLVCITFTGEIANRPILSELTETLKINFNLLQANIDNFNEKTYGIANIELCLQNNSLAHTIETLEAKGLHVEVLGYV